jgi:hypothetical protein
VSPPKTPRSYTPPKGRPTPKRSQQKLEKLEEVGRDARLQWAVVALIGLVAIVGLFVFFGDSGGNGISPTHNAPVAGHTN